MKNLKIYKTNSHLQGKTESEIKATNINALNSLSRGLPHYDSEGRKTHTNYYLDNDLVIRKTFKDIDDDIQITIKWFDYLGKHISKTWLVGLDDIGKISLKISRRKNVRNYILKEAENTPVQEVKAVFTAILNHTQSALETWVNSGDASYFNSILDDENSPIVMYMDLPTEVGLTVKEYLKEYIK